MEVPTIGSIISVLSQTRLYGNYTTLTKHIYIGKSHKA